MKKIIILTITGLIFYSCQVRKATVSTFNSAEEPKWTLETLNARANEHLDSSHWDKKLFQQDIATYEKYTEVFQSYPLNKSPFPVAEYDYAVSSIPFTIEYETQVVKGVRIGEYVNPDSDSIVDRLTLMVLSNDKESDESTLVDSRNFPYLTAEGYFVVTNNQIDWVFSASPDGYSFVVVNMKLFDLRFGETIIIYPQKDKSFLYDQIKDSPNNYANFELYRESIINNERVKQQLQSDGNIQ
ncbi:MAG: hypothetical protein CVU11_07860 [Bacteroidetes bacterium HGW-Bacteroidetes-6]|jgi:hypothetical protein|nr:MAG: hypothetical protein CVU11_07860 [Bacteroidetes bacterium HGW-Bacteroidetes-6]